MTTVLLDLTSLDTPSRNRGHGRYVRELALGLAELPPSERGKLEFRALTHLSLAGAYRVTDDIAGFEGTPGQPSPGPKEHYHWAYARRFGLARALRKIGAAAVHLADPNASPLLMSLTQCKKIVTCHDVIPARYPAIYFDIRDGGPRLGLAIERRRYRSADLVIAISDATEQDARTILGVRPERMVRVYNGVDVDRWQTQPSLDEESVLRRHGLSKQPFALYVGGPDWHKNVDGMLAGLATARSRAPEVHLAWAGKLNPAQSEHVNGLVTKHGVKGAVSFLGFVPDDELSVLYRCACAHVLVSWCEGFGLTVVEAMAAGCPVLTTSGGSLEEVAGDAAVKVDPADPEQIGAALVRLFRDSELRLQLAGRGRRRAPRFSRAVQARAMVRAYSGLLNA
ncbi:MAG TPA: glycosyltransferase family 1 protein [Polyangiaceae bacterium]|nr:glycosyltransferase family 1 protein [Polyangiaceae bacterium]